jgi:superfamily II DNA or RNA helicase
MSSNDSILEQGQLVFVRRRPALIREVKTFVDHPTNMKEHLVNVEYIDGWVFPSEDTLVWEREIGTRVLSKIALPEIVSPEGRPDDPERFDAFLDAMRWSTFGKMTNLWALSEEYACCNVISPWKSAVQVEDYQLYPVLKAMSMPRISLLLADDVGVGKTIEAGLILSELIAQRGIRRILIVCPASIQDQWKEELREKFNLEFVIMNSAEVLQIQKSLGMDANPWTTSPRIITSMDYLRQQDVMNRFVTGAMKLQPEGSALLPWDLLIVDEAHNLAPSQFGDDSLRCQMLRQISRFFDHRLFLTATPHDGFTVSFTGLLELLDPLRFSQKTVLDERDHAQIQASVVRRLKSELNANRAIPRFVNRDVTGIPLKLGDNEKNLFDALRRYRETGIKLAAKKGKREKNLGSFIFSILTKRLLSSSYAFARTWWNHSAGFDLEGFGFDEADQSRIRAETPVVDDAEKERRESDAVRHGAGWLQTFSKELTPNIQEISSLLMDMGWSKEVTQRGVECVDRFPADQKWDALLEECIKKYLIQDGKFRIDERLIIFTEYKDTQDYLVTRFANDKKWTGPVIQVLFGGVSVKERSLVKQEFNDPRSPLRVLVATDVAAEGLNLQASCRYVLHQEIPWNPMRLEQRNGRVDRYGQARDVTVFHFHSDEDADIQFLSYVANKVNQVREDLGSVGQVLDEAVTEHFSGRMLKTKDVDDRVSQVISLSAEKKDLGSRDKGNEQDYERSIHELQATEMRMGFTEDHLARLLSQASQLERGLLRMESSGTYRFDPYPPSWKNLVMSSVAVQEGDLAGSLPKLVFDPKHFSVTQNHRVLYRPRPDTLLLRLGHPVMQKAIAVMRRQLWGGNATVHRWTIVHAALPRGIDSVACVSCAVSLRNKLGEPAFAMVKDLPFVLTKSGAKSLEAGLWAEIQRLPCNTLPAEMVDQWKKVIVECWLEGTDSVLKAIGSLKARVESDFKKSFAKSLKKQQVEEVRLFEQRMKELDTEKNPRTLERLKRELAKAEEQALQLTFSEEKNQERRKHLKELQEKVSDVEWERQHTQVMILKQRLEADKDRILTKVLPDRYSLASVDVQPVAVKFIVQTEEAS